MIFAVFDPSPLTVCINCSFFTFICYSYGADNDEYFNNDDDDGDDNYSLTWYCFGARHLPCELQMKWVLTPGESEWFATVELAQSTVVSVTLRRRPRVQSAVELSVLFTPAHLTPESTVGYTWYNQSLTCSLSQPVAVNTVTQLAICDGHSTLLRLGLPRLMWRSSVRLSVSSTYSPWLTGWSMRHGQYTFPPDN